MKLIALSDVHGIDMNLFDPIGADICIIAGDIAPLRGVNRRDKIHQAEWLQEKFCTFIMNHGGTEFVFVAGNHDFWGVAYNGRESFWPKNAHYLKNSTCEVSGMKIWGSPLIPYIGCSRRWAFESSDDTLENTFCLIPDDTDIILTHTPPCVVGSSIDTSEGRYDITTGEPLHFGSAALTKAIERVQPRFAFCGHIHTGSHEEMLIGRTECRNVSLLDESYNLAYEPFVYED